MSDISAKSLLSLIPEIFFDVIARLVPGIVVLYLYERPEMSTSIDVILALALAYLIGLSLDFLGSASIEILLNRIAENWQNSKLATSGKIWEAINSQPTEVQMRSKKMWAEGVMFRSLFLFSLFALVCSFLELDFCPSLVTKGTSGWILLCMLAVLWVVCFLRIYLIMSISNVPTNNKK